MSRNSLNLSRGYGYVVGSNTPNYIIGRIMTIVEALGLKDTQEKSLKDLLRNEVWQTFSPDSALSILPEVNDRLWEAVENWRKEVDKHSDGPISEQEEASYEWSIKFAKK